MPEFSKVSLERLSTCDERLQLLFNEVIKTRDCSIYCGHRNEKDQTDAYNNKVSKLKYPNSNHNSLPSNAVDVMPYPIDNDDLPRIYMFVGYVQRVADDLGIAIRCGADWDGDTFTNDQTFHDLVHFELGE